MEFYKLFSCCVLVIVTLTNEMFGLQLFPSKSSEKAVFGENVFNLTCQFDLGTDDLFYLQLTRQREGGTPENVVLFKENDNPTSYQDTSLVSRTVLSLVTLTSTSKEATIQFNSIICSDKATYRWVAQYFNGSAAAQMNKTIIVPVMAVTTFVENVEPSYTPSTSLKEGDDVTFTCTGDVGEEPIGVYKWFYFLPGSTTGGVDVSSQANSATALFNDTSCSWSQTSSLVLRMVKEFNGIVVRCLVQQEQVEKYRLTNEIEVQYGPRTINVLSEPAGPDYYNGDASLNLTCSADANPPANYYWVTTSGNTTNVTDGAVYRFTDLEEENSGDYICVAYNTINLMNYTVNYTASIEVKMTTTTSTTTPTTPSSTEENNNTGNPGSSTGDDDDSKSNLGGIIGGVVAAFVAIVVVIIVVLCVMKRKKKPEIEEPPEKPRNNQGLTYYGNRPDLVTSELKNNQQNLNTSFSNSYDSSSEIKPRNEDGLNYIDLQFDDKPRSRRPIQILDVSGGGYGDIDLPRV